MGTRHGACVQMTAWNRRPGWPMSCSSGVAQCWRSPEHPVVHRHHPLPSAEIGTSIGQFSGDELHTLHLDVFRVLTLRAPWLFCGLWASGRGAQSEVTNSDGDLVPHPTNAERLVPCLRK